MAALAGRGDTGKRSREALGKALNAGVSMTGLNVALFKVVLGGTVGGAE